MKGIIDRIEGDFVVIEYKDIFLNLPLILFPKDVKENDIVTLSVTIEKIETEEKYQSTKDRLNSLFKKEKGKEKNYE